MEDIKNDEWKKLIDYFRSKNGSFANFLKATVTKPAYSIVIVSNLAIFLIPGMDLKEQSISFLWIYLMQSILIGVVHVFKMFTYKFAIPTRADDWKSPVALGVFFIFHYGFFHFIYSVFVPASMANWNIVLQGASIFAFTLLLNTIRHYKKENSGKYNANDFMFLPYLRIFPIHIAIILGSFLAAMVGNYLPVFIVLAVLKTLMELALEYLQSLGVSMAEMSDRGLIGK
jgi:hypothetical protein